MSTSKNIYWREALASSEGVQRSPCDKFFLSGGAVVFWHGQESHQAELALDKASAPKRFKAVRTNKPDSVMDPVWISNRPTGHDYACNVFGMMLRLSLKIKSYHSDLYHDAYKLSCVSDFKVGSEIIWLAHECGSHICVAEDGFPSCFVPDWYPGAEGDGRFKGKTYRFKVELIGEVPHWTVTRFKASGTEDML